MSTTKTYLVREGDGNDGTFKRGFIEATDAFEALRKASRRGMISKPKVVTLGSMEGDDMHAYLTDYREGFNGCRWTAEAYLAD